MQGDICTSICKYELMEAGRIVHAEIEEVKVRIYQLLRLPVMCFQLPGLFYMGQPVLVVGSFGALHRLPT
ncbi:MAG: hypothetical protein IRD7MM_05215 [Candidatus Midichloria mitochondrii]|nr:hypothetical protein [Candidatus Midichloria mitochondrii]